MSRLVSRILLAVLMIPAAIIVFFISIILIQDLFRSGRSRLTQESAFTIGGLMTWAFMASYWFLLWRSSTHWTIERRIWTLMAAVGSALIAALAGWLLNVLDHGFGYIMGGIIAPIVWLIWVTILWRETSAERTERIRSMDKTALVCPSCGYNLTGLQGTRCPECGTLYTLNELIAAQPSRAEDITE